MTSAYLLRQPFDQQSFLGINSYLPEWPIWKNNLESTDQFKHKRTHVSSQNLPNITLHKVGFPWAFIASDIVNYEIYCAPNISKAPVHSHVIPADKIVKCGLNNTVLVRGLAAG